ncbi:MAG: Spi family protease inhibitor, partial [Paludibacteraceae bacterium]|nr:Spi family protease inhibitor [Paludibacteraceae bacterium]
MRFLLHTLIAILFAFNTHATEISIIDVAQNLASKYCQNPSLKKTGIKPYSSLRSASEKEPSYFIFTNDTTNKFCIVSADAEKVLGYGDNYSEILPPQLQEILDMYAAAPQRLPELRNSNTRENIPAFMDVVFGTRSPYNKYIPDRDGYGPPVGCVPVTLAQIAK